ncbi:MAG: hypothetical protein R3C53_03730 [Pirellulaceae bacterium]
MVHTRYLTASTALAIWAIVNVHATSVIHAQETTPSSPQSALVDKAPIDDSERTASPQAKQALFEKFTKLMTGAKMTGQFTVDGKPLGEQEAESYDIEKVEKQPDGDLWIITARIKYGKRDLTIPVPIEVKWAGTTPVMTLDDLTLPGFGTFSARVVLHKDKYAGTWTHGEVGGHMFGYISFKDEEK